MRKSIQTGLSILCSILAIGLLILLLSMLADPNLWVNTEIIVLMLIVVFALSVLAFILARKYYSFARNNSYLWLLGFLLYLLFLGYLLFFSKEFARDRVDLSSTHDYFFYLKLQWTYSVNLIPFSSINDMISVFDSSYRNYSFINLAGNLIAFMPFALFLPILIKNMNWKRFFLIMSTIIISVEIIQFLTFTGSMDIDDYILNIIGSLIAYAFLSIPFIKGMLRKYAH